MSPDPPIVPRWEWRTFGEDLGDAEAVFARRTPDRERESDEIYLLSTLGDTSVKLRDELVDVKRLDRVDDAGLELWMPEMKQAFPLSAGRVAAVLDAAGATGVALRRESYTREQFALDIIEPDPHLLALGVHKRRVHYRLDECMVELTDIEAVGRRVRTIAIEDADSALVRATIDRLGLGERPNVNMARGLKTLVGFGSRRNAVVDVGTNSVKFHLGEQHADGTIHAVADRAEMTRLGEGLDRSGVLTEAAIARTVAAIAAMHDQARHEHATTIAIVGTAGLRSAANRSDFDDALRARTGRTIEILSGDDEARLAYLAAISALPIAHRRLVAFDSGGGSTQFTFGYGTEVAERFSLDVGSVRVAERFGLGEAVSRHVVDDALAALDAAFVALDDRPEPDAVIGIGGTVTNLAAVKLGLARYDPEAIQGAVLHLEDIDEQIERYRTRSADERRTIVGLQTARAEVILGGACIVRTILSKLGVPSFTVSDRGLRHGVFIERFTEGR
jgi:exopolyphosphatase/guanosine-5'-triphosphate,3'-diphosphate pyrophosphatase